MDRSHITMAQGAGGEAMQGLIKEVILKALATDTGSPVQLTDLDDSSVVGDVVFTTDAHTVKPLFFPGGDIGMLSVCGTINDVSVLGAKPEALSLAMVVEEGFSADDLERALTSAGETAKAAGVPIVTGDTKVVEKGAIDKLVMVTSAFGYRHPKLDENFERVHITRQTKKQWLTDSNLGEGDVIISSGYLGDHGIALLSFREGYGFKTPLESDTAALNGLMDTIINVGGVVAAKDPTRGGLANTLNEWAEKSGIGVHVMEEDIPIRQGVRSACELLGLDPLEIGNEGKVIVAVVEEAAEEVLAAMRSHPNGKDAAIIGRTDASLKGVALETEVGSLRVMDPPIGDPIPRIC